MTRSQNIERIHLCLDEQSYKVLQAKAAYERKAMNAYLIDLASRIIMASFTIRVHDLSEMLENLDKLTFKASGYYNRVVERGSDFLSLEPDDAAKMLSLFKNLSSYLANFHEELLKNRDTDIVRESEYIEQVISEAEKSRRMHPDVITELPSRYDVELVMTPEKKEKLLKNIEKSKVFRGEDLSEYFKTLIMSKYFIDLYVETDDLTCMSEFVYSAKRYCKAFLTIMKHQERNGLEGMPDYQELMEAYDMVLYHQKEIWKIIENDRKMLYQKYMNKIRINYKAMDKMTRRLAEAI